MFRFIPLINNLGIKMSNDDYVRGREDAEKELRPIIEKYKRLVLAIREELFWSTNKDKIIENIKKSIRESANIK
jgi:hypothetical protein